MRVLIVDDSAFMRRAIGRMLSHDQRIEVVGVARNGREGLDMAGRLHPDVITLDIEMPEMDGLTALRHIMRQCPTQVLMLSSLTTKDSQAALQALKLGAADVLAKTSSQVSLSINEIEKELIERVVALGAAGRRSAKQIISRESPPPILNARHFDVICIGSSTGGPPVLETILTALPATMRLPIVVAQHMPAVFTESMTLRLSDLCRMPVVHIEEGMMLKPGQIHIAPGGKHLHLVKKSFASVQFKVSDEPTTAPYRPSVDVLFATAAQTFGKRMLAVILTGMGNDGLKGAQQLHEKGGVILAQSQETCVVYGMPKGVTEQGIAIASLSPRGLARCLASLAAPSATAAA